jgi:hypothetical protein
VSHDHQRRARSELHTDDHAGVAPGKRTRSEARGEAQGDVQRQAVSVPQLLPSAPATDGADPFGLHVVQRAGGAAGTDAGVHAAAAHGLGGASQALPFHDQIQQSFGRHDVGHVQAHTGPEAAEGARAMGAQAFASGDHVAFAGAPDLHTAAHEAAHVVQQRAGVHLKGGVGEVGDAYERQADAIADRVVAGQSSEALLDQAAGAGGGGEGAVQRKIVIDGTDYDPTPDLPAVEKKYGKDMVEALVTMHAGGKPPVHTYKTKDLLMTELNLRDEATKGMGKANSDGDTLRYSTRSGDSQSGQLDPTYWEKKGFYLFTLKSGAKPSAAVRSIFEGKDNVLECNSTMVAIEYRSMLETMGDVAFDKRFLGGGLVISPHHVAMPEGGKHPIHTEGMIQTVTIASSKDLIPGDWVYFKNFGDYIDKHPGGFWSGEHTMYLGDGKFQGFGTEESTEDGINKKLLAAYNDGLPGSQQKKLEDLPGLQNYARRPVAENIVK